ncbi:MAG: outer membrane protein assembly factor BamA, partial [Cellvibrionaceae bacterium]|nr:outer membrane protein assembly factor BamA [Cellvibrionaceae bacterium]
MKRVLVSLVLAALSSPVFSLDFRIGDIRLEGLQRVSASPVFAAMPVKVGDYVNDENVRQVMRDLFATGFFSNIQVARDANVLIVVLQERPAIKSIEIDGNKAIKTEQLTEVMNDNDLREGEILQRDTLQGIARELERQYVSRARYGASVETKVEELPNNMVKINIDVDEGKAAKIKHFNIVGNSKYSDKELLKLLELSESKWNSIFTSSDKYAKEKLTGDIETLESFYLNRGYLDFEVLSTQISIAPNKESVYITLNIQEGEIYQVSSIDIAGDPIFPEERVRRLVLLREGDTFSQRRMTDTSEYISTLLGNSGYTNVKVEGVPKKNKDDSTVDLTFFIDPGKRVYVRRVEFRGNTKTADHVLRREMRQFEGASASNARIEQSKVRLERLGFFKEVRVETRDVPGASDLIDVEYSVEEQSSGSISASIGYAQQTGVNIGVNVQQTNWLGSGKEVSFGINRNLYQTLYSFSYTDPYFTPEGVSRGLSLYYRTRDYDRINVSQYSTDSYGGFMSFGYPISEISRVRFSLGLTNQSVETGDFAPKEIIGSPQLIDGFDTQYVRQTDYEASRFFTDPYQLDSFRITEAELDNYEPGFIDKFGSEFNSATFDLSWSRITLNRGILATRGNSQRITFEATVPGSDLEYYKLLYNAQLFAPISRNFTLRFKTRLGYGNGYGKMDELPFFENFFGGGFGSVRGYER